MQAHSRWLHAIRKRVITEKKMWRKYILKYAINFTSTQLRITRLRKYMYPIDPKAYLGRCLCHGTDNVRHPPEIRPPSIPWSKTDLRLDLQATHWQLQWKGQQNSKSTY